jgi:CubicO group peptidase (beta-lactamase class C family)
MLLAHQSSLNDNTELIDGWFSLMMGFTSILGYPDYPYPRIKEYIVPNGSLYKKSIWMDKPPGGVALYSNIGFMLLENLFECISGQSLEEYCRENIFKPLNMMNTSFQLSHFDRKQIAIPYVRLSLIKFPLPHFQLAHASSNLRTTCEDLSHFLIAHMNGGVYNGVRILNESTVNIMHTIQYPNGNYGLGWIILEEDLMQGHGGVWLGCTASMWMRKSDNVGIISFANAMVNTNKKLEVFAYHHILDELFLKDNEF